MRDTINLLPDTKQQRLKESRLRKTVLTVALSVMAVAIGVPVLLLTIKGAQALTLSRTQTQINERKTQIQQTPDITTMLTVKDHLDSLPNLYSQRAYFSNLIEILPKVTPKSVRLTDLELSGLGTITFRGVASTYNEVEKFNKALQIYGLEYNPNRIEQDPNAAGLFTGVKVVEVSGPAGTEVAFTINANFDLAIISGVDNGN